MKSAPQNRIGSSESFREMGQFRNVCVCDCFSFILRVNSINVLCREIQNKHWISICGMSANPIPIIKANSFWFYVLSLKYPPLPSLAYRWLSYFAAQFNPTQSNSPLIRIHFPRLLSFHLYGMYLQLLKKIKLPNSLIQLFQQRMAAVKVFIHFLPTSIPERLFAYPHHFGGAVVIKEIKEQRLKHSPI